MALNTRSSIDPRWAFAHRAVARGAMLCSGVLYRTTAGDPATVAWRPFALDPVDRAPGAPAAWTPIYQGPARVQPNQGWRSKVLNFRDETTAQQATLVQLDLSANQLAIDYVTDFPIVKQDDVFRVTDVLTVGGVPVSSQLLNKVFVVRATTSSSNSWTFDAWCDELESVVGDPIG